MAIEKMNMPQPSKNFDGNLASFLRSNDWPQSLGRYVMETAYQQSFFSNFPWLVYRKVSDQDRVGDLVYIDEKFNVCGMWPWMPWPYKSTRQLAGNEDIIDAAYRRDKMSVGQHRYSVAVENFLQTDLLPTDVIAKLKSNITAWATMTEDTDISCTLFRDFPYYFAETDGLTSTEIDERIMPLFGRGTYNDVNVDPLLIMPNSKTDIEDLANTDTLSDTFCEYLQQVCDQEIGMPTNQLEDWRPFYGLMWVGDADVQNFFKNSSTQFKTSLDQAFRWAQWKHPIFQKFIWEFANIRMAKYDWMATNDWRNAYADHMSVYKHMMGSPYEPMAKILAATAGNGTVTDMKTWDRGAYDLTTPSTRNGLNGQATTYNLYVSGWAVHFPYFDNKGSTTVWASSYNKFAITSTEAALSYCGLNAGALVGRLQIGELSAAGGKFKILYTWPVYVWTIQLAANKTKFAQVHSVYRLQVRALYEWSGTGWTLVDSANIATKFASLKTWLGIDSTNHIQVGWAYSGITYQKRRKIHIFNTIRWLVFGKDLIFDADLLKGQRVKMEERDYGAITGWWMTMSKGRKIAVAGDGTIRNYWVVVWKRPSILG